MRRRGLVFLAVLPILAACGGPPVANKEAGRQRYLTAKADCVAHFRSSLVAQSDCRSRAADLYIRPFYKYGDLMDRAQSQRRALAALADRHEISRPSYEREVARSEAAISREEDRRGRLATRGDTGPFTHVLNGIAELFR